MSHVREPLLSETARLRPDLVLGKNGERVIVEVKRPSLSKKAVEIGVLQLCSYLEASKAEHGILYIPPLADERTDVTTSTHRVGDRDVYIHLVVPKRTD